MPYKKLMGSPTSQTPQNLSYWCIPSTRFLTKKYGMGQEATSPPPSPAGPIGDTCAHQCQSDRSPPPTADTVLSYKYIGYIRTPLKIKRSWLGQNHGIFFCLKNVFLALCLISVLWNLSMWDKNIENGKVLIIFFIKVIKFLEVKYKKLAEVSYLISLITNIYGF